jgi:DNA polymerase
VLAPPTTLELLRTAAPVNARVPHRMFLDDETRSPRQLTKVGAHVYATDPLTEPICLAWAVDDRPVQYWLRGDPVPTIFFEVAEDPTNWEVYAHNAPFEMAIGQHVLPRYGFPVIPRECYRCTMAMSLALALPAKLGALADALELEHRKDAAGERLMHQMSKPRKPRKGEDPKGIYYFDDPERLDRLVTYVVKDVEVLRELADRLLRLSDFEHELWQLSCLINDRGFHVDRSFAEAMRAIAKAAAPEIDAEIAELTDGAVTSINQVARLLKWLHSQGA